MYNRKEYYRTHKKQSNAASKAYYEAHKEEARIKQKAYLEKPGVKERRKITQKLWKRKNRLRALYNLTNKQFNEMLIDQCGLCAICNKQMIGYRNCCVDHDHRTFRVRGLLCNGCNRLLGCVDDSTDILHSAIDYLED